MTEAGLGNPIPKAEPDDHEDVSWALSTAEATWSRGDRPDALKWLRRAAEAASEAEADDRALQLAKAAAEIATSLEEGSKTGPPSSGEEAIPVSMSTEAPAPSKVDLAVTSPALVPQRPPTAAAQKPPHLPKIKPEAQKPKAPATLVGSSAAAKMPRASDSHPKAPAKLILAPPSEPSNPALARSANSTGELPAAPHSEENLFRPRPAPPTAASAPEVSASDIEESGPITPRSKRNTQNPTAAPGADDGEDMESWPTQAMTGNELPSFDSIEDRTRIGTPAYREPDPEPSHRAPIPMRGARPSQAVRVIVWRGPDGVHVAPYGTTVSAISVDAMLVALDPSADLSAWLSNK